MYDDDSGHRDSGHIAALSQHCPNTVAALQCVQSVVEATYTSATAEAELWREEKLLEEVV